ncbi:glycoside hydrolase domain-containing protein [Kutzneria sp. CA-103260]|uniref:glycoside hydrolase domain-containing protein n=1 Tax=Kutzneria sp. CA-103260 TaxID=2802641 RepID=UPI001BAB6D95|nr:glycoside hydrolase domain-containing protein [Kutzneria sp. CA-103260]QUQ63078.1 hypothetical protein JJ691_07900 [Kutzneria sp. CA-103260]
MDQKVLDAQQWVNATYRAVPGYVACPEDGHTGWSTMYALTMGLQHELGITELAASFGPTTLAKLTAKGDIGPGYDNANIIRILQHGLFCKGYWGADEYGVYDSFTGEAVLGLKSDAGITTGGSAIQPKVAQAILNMDAYVLLSGGSDAVRTIQQWFNGNYLNHSSFAVIPCDGHYSRDVQKALMRALQYQFGVADGDATGNFGPVTQAGLRAHPVGQGDSGVFVQLFSAACVFNGSVHDNNGETFTTAFKDTFDDKLGQYVHAFQEFSALPVTSTGDYATWCQLLVSCGDPDRRATGSDTRFQITPDRGAAMHAAGYSHVGRYLDDPPDSTLNKKIQPGELNDIFNAGLRMFPIWQYGARELGDFTYTAGYQHALLAHQRAVGYGFNAGTVIYFAVDYDATNDDIDSNILPYFHGVQAGLASQGKRYVAGVYGSRNVCSRATDQAFARFSFVSGMSYGFSGNLGFPMPDNWSFTQIKEFSFTAASSGPFDLDNDVIRPNADNGVGRENVNGTSSPVDEVLTYIDRLYATAQSYNKGDPSLRVMEYLRYPKYVDLYKGWQTLIGDVDRDWIAYADLHGPVRLSSFPDPSYGVNVDLEHFGATTNAVYLKGGGSGTVANRGDFGGWGGDICTFYGDWRNNADAYASGYAFCMDRLAKLNVSSSFPFDDMIEDVDGYLIGTAVSGGTPINQAMRAHLAGGGHLSRFKQFYDRRYGGSVANAKATADSILEGDLGDVELEALRTAAIRSTGGWDVLLPALMPADKLDPFLQGYADTIQALVGQENARAKR